jgi:DNA-binding cell septation regulator SpoVG
MAKKLITNVEIIPIIPKQGHIAFANVILEDKVALNGIGIHTCLSKGGFRLVYPDKILPNGKRIHLFYPIAKAISREIEGTIISQYEELLEKVAKG